MMKGVKITPIKITSSSPGPKIKPKRFRFLGEECGACSTFIPKSELSEELRSECGTVYYCSVECKHHAELDLLAKCESLVFRPIFSMKGSEELEEILGERVEVKGLDYASGDHLLHSVVQILGFLEQSQLLAFSAEWREFYSGKSTKRNIKNQK